MENVQVRFIENYQVKDETKTSFTAGQQLSMRHDSALHFVNRGVAEIVADKEAKKPAKKPAKK